MALTLIEATKLMDGEVFRRTIIELFARETDLLRVLPMENITGNAIRYNQEDTLPGVAFRGVGEGYTEATGIVNPQTENLVILGGDMDVDKFIVRTHGSDQRAVHERMKIKAMSHNYSNTFIKGDSLTTQREFDGLQTRIGLTGDQSISNGSTSGGDPLSLVNLDEAIDACDDPTHLLMSKAMRRRLSQATRARDNTATSTPVEPAISYGRDEFGRMVTMYQDLPILLADRNADQFATLAFDEVATGGGTTATSIYVLSLRPGMLTGIQNGPPEVVDLGELDDLPVFRTRMEWYNGLWMPHPRAAARLHSISDAPIEP